MSQPDAPIMPAFADDAVRNYRNAEALLVQRLEELAFLEDLTLAQAMLWTTHISTAVVDVGKTVGDLTLASEKLSRVANKTEHNDDFFIAGIVEAVAIRCSSRYGRHCAAANKVLGALREFASTPTD
jgi:uncharacterized protein YoxC